MYYSRLLAVAYCLAATVTAHLLYRDAYPDNFRDQRWYFSGYGSIIPGVVLLGSTLIAGRCPGVIGVLATGVNVVAALAAGVVLTAQVVEWWGGPHPKVPMHNNLSTRTVVRATLFVLYPCALVSVPLCLAEWVRSASEIPTVNPRRERD